jgi:hypothetical protein
MGAKPRPTFAVSERGIFMLILALGLALVLLLSVAMGGGFLESSSSSSILQLPQYRRHQDPQLRRNQQSYNGTIVVQLSGEMGNNLHKLAFGKALQWMAYDSFQLNLNVVLRHQDHPKWLSAKGHLHKCFVNLKHFNFKAGNGPEFTERQLEQTLWLGRRGDGDEKKGLEISGNEESNMMAVLQQLKRIVESTSSMPPHRHDRDDSRSTSSSSTIYLPFIVADQMVSWSVLDRYRSRLVDWFAFDDQACCPSELPQRDESVFHFRNFVTELKGVTTELGFDELSPNQTVQHLLGHLSPGNKVAITTRFDNEVSQGYVAAMQQKGLKVRLMSGHSPTQDFCFLTKAHKELIGGQRSSFFIWAAYLGVDGGSTGGIQKIRSYSVDPPASFSSNTKGADKHATRLPYEWKDPLLKERWEFHVYASENRIPTKIQW